MIHKLIFNMCIQANRIVLVTARTINYMLNSACVIHE